VQCAQWAGSTATHVSSGLGGGLLQAGAAIQVQDARVCADREGDLPVPAFARLQHGARVVLGPQTAQFMPQATTALLEARFSVTAASDRMGMRLDGPGLVLRDALSIPSEPILHGSIQVGGDGVASILLADHQTTGGYPKIATIVSADLDAVSQLRPGDGLRFQALGAAQAVRVARSHAQARRQYLEAVAMPRGALADRLMRENLISGVVGQGATDADLP
jgi:allophanate hydrolase subunit 2